MNNDHIYKFISYKEYNVGDIMTLKTIDTKPCLDFIKKNKIFFNKDISVSEDEHNFYIVGRTIIESEIFIACYSKNTGINKWIINSKLKTNETINICVKNGLIYIVGSIINNKLNNLTDFNNNNVFLVNNKESFICCIEYGKQKWFKLLNNYYSSSSIIADDIFIYLTGYINNYIYVSKYNILGNLEWIKKSGPFYKTSNIKIIESYKYLYIASSIYKKRGIDNNNIIGFNNEIIYIKGSPYSPLDQSFIFISCLKKEDGIGWVRLAGNSGCLNIVTDICCYKHNLYLTGVIQNTGLNYTSDFNNKIINLRSYVKKNTLFNPYDIFVSCLSAECNLENEWMKICGGNDNDGIDDINKNIYPKISCYKDVIYVTGFIKNPINKKMYNFSGDLIKLKNSNLLTNEIFVSCLLNNGKEEWFKTCNSINKTYNLNTGLSIYASYDKVYITGILTNPINKIIDFYNNSINLEDTKNIYTFIGCINKNKSIDNDLFIINKTDDIVLSISNIKNKYINIIGYLNNNFMYISKIICLKESVKAYGIVLKSELYKTKTNKLNINYIFREIDKNKYETTITCKGLLRLDNNLKVGKKYYYYLKDKKISDICFIHYSDYIYLGKAIDNKTIKLEIGKKYIKINKELKTGLIYYNKLLNNKIGFAINKTILLIN